MSNSSTVSSNVAPFTMSLRSLIRASQQQAGVNNFLPLIISDLPETKRFKLTQPKRPGPIKLRIECRKYWRALARYGYKLPTGSNAVTSDPERSGAFFLPRKPEVELCEEGEGSGERKRKRKEDGGEWEGKMVKEGQDDQQGLDGGEMSGDSADSSDEEGRRSGEDQYGGAVDDEEGGEEDEEAEEEGDEEEDSDTASQILAAQCLQSQHRKRGWESLDSWSRRNTVAYTREGSPIWLSIEVDHDEKYRRRKRLEFLQTGYRTS
jgi:hypothetical protein